MKKFSLIVRNEFDPKIDIGCFWIFKHLNEEEYQCLFFCDGETLAIPSKEIGKLSISVYYGLNFSRYHFDKLDDIFKHELVFTFLINSL